MRHLPRYSGPTPSTSLALLVKFAGLARCRFPSPHVRTPPLFLYNLPWTTKLHIPFPQVLIQETQLSLSATATATATALRLFLPHCSAFLVFFSLSLFSFPSFLTSSPSFSSSISLSLHPPLLSSVPSYFKPPFLPFPPITPRLPYHRRLALAPPSLHSCSFFSLAFSLVCPLSFRTLSNP